MHAVGDQHLDGGLLRRVGKRMRVAADVQRSGDACGLRYSAMAWEMATIWASLKEVFSEEPRCPEVPKETRCSGFAGSGMQS
jgi:hypothetical protein